MVYLLINFPLVLFVKIGKTKISVGAKKRARQVDKAAPGVPIPVGIIFCPGLEGWVERRLHAANYLLRVRFYKGDGHTEWFWVPAVLPYYGAMVLNWGAIYLILQAIYLILQYLLQCLG